MENLPLENFSKGSLCNIRQKQAIFTVIGFAASLVEELFYVHL